MTTRLSLRPARIALLAATMLAAGACAALAAARGPLTIDYVIGMIESGIPQQEIVSRIHESGLTFRLAEGDLDRLRAAGAGEALMKAVTAEAALPETPGTAAPSPPSAEGPKPGSAEAPDGWSRPRRLGQAPPADEGQGDVAPEEDEGDREGEGGYEPQGGNDWMTPRYGAIYHAPGYYVPGYYPPWPYGYGYYDPFLSFYYYPGFSFYYPYYYYGGHHGFFSGHGGGGGRPGIRVSPRGSSGGGHGPHGGGSARPAPRGGSRPPRGH